VLDGSLRGRKFHSHLGRVVAALPATIVLKQCVFWFLHYSRPANGLVVTPTDRHAQFFHLLGDEQTEAHRRRKERAAGRGGFRRLVVVAAAGVHFLHALGGRLVAALVLVGVDRHEETGEIPARRRLWQHFGE